MAGSLWQAPRLRFQPVISTRPMGWNSPGMRWARRSEEHTSELQSLMRTSYAVFCLKKKTRVHYAGGQQDRKQPRLTHVTNAKDLRWVLCTKLNYYQRASPRSDTQQ